MVSKSSIALLLARSKPRASVGTLDGRSNWKTWERAARAYLRVLGLTITHDTTSLDNDDEDAAIYVLLTSCVAEGGDAAEILDGISHLAVRNSLSVVRHSSALARSLSSNAAANSSSASLNRCAFPAVISASALGPNSCSGTQLRPRQWVHPPCSMPSLDSFQTKTSLFFLLWIFSLVSKLSPKGKNGAPVLARLGSGDSGGDSKTPKMKNHATLLLPPCRHDLDLARPRHALRHVLQ